MELVDHTPFATLAFESLTPDGQSFQVVVIRGTFDLFPGVVVRPCPEQKPVIVADEYFGQPGRSSLRNANDLAPFKPNTDLILNATAYAPDGRPHTEWPVEVQIGSLRKRLKVTGPRHWRHIPLVGWSLTAVEACELVPVRYERAYGGEWKHEQDSGVCEHNPAGTGFLNPRFLRPEQEIPAPQILSPDGRLPPLGQPTQTEGLGAIAPAWLPRRSFAGTYDEEWQKSRAPRSPADFKYDFYNAAHPDLIYDGYLKGGESVRLLGLNREGELAFTLPRFEIGIVVTDKAGFRYASLANLDTFQVDVNDKCLALVWRAATPIFEDGIAHLEIKMRSADGKTYG